MSLRSTLGLDGFDLAIHGLVTGILMFWIAATNRQEDAIIGCSMAAISSLVVLAIRRRFALRRMERVGTLNTGEMTAERLVELEQRVVDLEAAQGRVAELEERLDFAERMLAQTSAERVALPRGGGGSP